MSRLTRIVATAGAATLVLALTTLAGGAASAAPAQPTLVAVSATHSSGHDRIVLTFNGALPAHRTLTWVDQLTADASGRPLLVAGHRFFALRVSSAVAHNGAGTRTVPSKQTYNLPNITQSVIAGDFEGVVTVGVGVQRHTITRMTTLSSPSRIVVDLAVPYQTQRVKAWFFNADLFASGAYNYRIERFRPAIAPAVARQALERLFAGPTRWELARGYRFVTSRTTGFTDLRIADGIARVRLTGRCYGGGSSFTVASEILPTLKQFASVDHVKIYGPQGFTQRPTGNVDSIPPCLAG
jgi:hypothetical protein